jgi:hypothetical protein
MIVYILNSLSLEVPYVVGQCPPEMVCVPYLSTMLLQNLQFA